VTTAAQLLDQYTNGGPFPLLGVREDPAGSNDTPVGDEFGWNGVAWCCETVSVAHNRCALPLHRASCWFAIQDYKARTVGDWIGRPDDINDVRAGDQVFYGNAGSDHTGTVAMVSGGRLMVYEGNYADQCMPVWRNYDGFVYGFGRPPFDAPITPPQEPSPPLPGSEPLDFSTFAPPLNWYLRKNYLAGDTIKIAQAFYSDLCSHPLTVDGVYGPATAAATRDYQAFFGLTVDGVYGPVTATHQHNLAVMRGWTL
jgi:hypothetical protein